MNKSFTKEWLFIRRGSLCIAVGTSSLNTNKLYIANYGGNESGKMYIWRGFYVSIGKEENR